MCKSIIISIIFLLSLIFNLPVLAEDSESIWGSLKYSKTYLRTGPSKDNKVMWVYKKKGLPVKLMRTKGDWKEVILPKSQKGWINSSQFSKIRTALISDNVSETEKVLKNHKPLSIKDKNKNPIAYVHKGVIVKLISCSNDLCEVGLDIKKEKYFFRNSYSLNGYIEKNNLWGVE